MQSRFDLLHKSHTHNTEKPRFVSLHDSLFSIPICNCTHHKQTQSPCASTRISPDRNLCFCSLPSLSCRAALTSVLKNVFFLRKWHFTSASRVAIYLVLPLPPSLALEPSVSKPVLPPAKTQPNAVVHNFYNHRTRFIYFCRWRR